jgi:hypothetical protein
MKVIQSQADLKASGDVNEIAIVSFLVQASAMQLSQRKAAYDMCGWTIGSTYVTPPQIFI